MPRITNIVTALDAATDALLEVGRFTHDEGIRAFALDAFDRLSAESDRLEAPDSVAVITAPPTAEDLAYFQRTHDEAKAALAGLRARQREGDLVSPEAVTWARQDVVRTKVALMEVKLALHDAPERYGRYVAAAAERVIANGRAL